jgi:hypothetical protein
MTALFKSPKVPAPDPEAVRGQRRQQEAVQRRESELSNQQVRGARRGRGRALVIGQSVLAGKIGG